LLFVCLHAAPSRDLDLRQQLPSLDESFAEPAKYRTPSPAYFLAGERFLLIYLSLSLIPRGFVHGCQIGRKSSNWATFGSRRRPEICPWRLACYFLDDFLNHGLPLGYI